MTTILNGKSLSENTLRLLKMNIILENYTPSLAVVIVGKNPASQIYVRKKNETAQNLGINSSIIELPADISQKELETEIEKLANDKNINAILVQLPLPLHINTQKIIEKIPPEKDVDGFHPYNLGKLFAGYEPYAIPCTPLGIKKLLDTYNIELEGKNVVIVGRSNIVGKPLSALFTNNNATVTLCHSKTKNLKEITSKADIFVAATGRAKFFTAEYIKEGAVVIDVGINHDKNGVLCGDVDFENVKNKVSYITPVPKGVGPMTIAMLMHNTVELYKKTL